MQLEVGFALAIVGALFFFTNVGKLLPVIGAADKTEPAIATVGGTILFAAGWVIVFYIRVF